MNRRERFQFNKQSFLLSKWILVQLGIIIFSNLLTKLSKAFFALITIARTVDGLTVLDRSTLHVHSHSFNGTIFWGNSSASG